MTKLTRTLVQVAGGIAFIALAALTVFVFAVGNAVREHDRAAVCEALVQGRSVKPTPPYLQYKTRDDVRPGAKVVWFFRKELIRDDSALAQLKVQAKRCNLEFLIETNSR